MQMNQSVQSLYELFAKNLMQINIWLSDGRRGSPIWLKVNHQIKKKKIRKEHIIPACPVRQSALRSKKL